MLNDYVVKPAGGWVLPQGDPDYEDDDRLGAKLLQLVEQRHAQRRELFALLGTPLYAKTTLLPLPAATAWWQQKDVLGPAYTRNGTVLKWGLWAPHKRVLIDLFPRGLPPTEECEDRARFATEHRLHYAVVKPGFHLTPDSLREWLEKEGVTHVISRAD